MTRAPQDSLCRILDSCVAIDTAATSVYGRMAEATPSPALRELFTAMEADERHHVGWWLELQKRYEEGSLQVPFADAAEVADQLASVVDEIGKTVPADLESLDERQMLLVATKIEYFALEPAISELIDLAEGSSDGQREYDEHLERLMRAIETEGYVDDSLSIFLVRVLRRAWHNSNAMAGMAMKDSLSGLFNRRALTVLLDQMLASAVRYGEAFSLLMIDIDDFKSVNDRFGHVVGDEAIVSVSGMLSSVTRDSDMVARFGGDEFVILAPRAGSAESSRLAQRVEDAAAAISIQHAGADLSVTLSIGIAVVEPGAGAREATSDRVLTAADAGLYRAKEQGKARYAEPVVMSAA
jgi:diguanylate cyclase (GGDEF)-like protein